jgi:hypothetical protein
MPYSIPAYIGEAKIDDARLRYVWDDTRASRDFRYSADWVVDAISSTTLRGKVAVGLGIYEWIACRFNSVNPDPLPFQVVEAGWCANVKRDYMRYFELNRGDWLGPIRGPLWCSTTWLLPMIFFSDDKPEEWQSGVKYLTRMAVHVISDRIAFESWLKLCISRVTKLHVQMPEDPFEDLFSEREEERRGALISKEVLDPKFDYQPDLAPNLVARYLRSADFTGNPLLQKT